MTRALAWIRKSKGSDDDIGLEMQREEVLELAERVGDDIDRLDLGVQTGFSSLTRDDDHGLLDQRDDVADAVDAIERGDYDLLVAWDDRRICRDDYLSVIEYACVQGDCEMVFVSDDVKTDDLAYDIHRRVEQATKQEEISKARAAVEERQRRGYWQGGEPFGLQFDDAGHYLVPDDDFETVMTVFDRAEAGVSYREIRDQTDVPISTINSIVDRGREFYEARS